MARRGLLTEDERQLMFGVPRQEHLIIKHYTLSQYDLDLILRKRGASQAAKCPSLSCLF